MTLWELAKHILHSDGELGMCGLREHKQDAAKHFRGWLKDGVSNFGAYDDTDTDLFETVKDFEYDHYDGGMGRVFHCGSMETDNQGQLIIYTGWYLWSDGTVRNTSEGK